MCSTTLQFLTSVELQAACLPACLQILDLMFRGRAQSSCKILLQGLRYHYLTRT